METNSSNISNIRGPSVPPTTSHSVSPAPAQPPSHPVLPPLASGSSSLATRHVTVSTTGSGSLSGVMGHWLGYPIDLKERGKDTAIRQAMNDMQKAMNAYLAYAADHPSKPYSKQENELMKRMKTHLETLRGLKEDAKALSKYSKCASLPGEIEKLEQMFPRFQNRDKVSRALDRIAKLEEGSVTIENKLKTFVKVKTFLKGFLDKASKDPYISSKPELKPFLELFGKKKSFSFQEAGQFISLAYPTVGEKAKTILKKCELSFSPEKLNKLLIKFSEELKQKSSSKVEDFDRDLYALNEGFLKIYAKPPEERALLIRELPGRMEVLEKKIQPLSEQAFLKNLDEILDNLDRFLADLDPRLMDSNVFALKETRKQLGLSHPRLRFLKNLKTIGETLSKTALSSAYDITMAKNEMALAPEELNPRFQEFVSTEEVFKNSMEDLSYYHGALDDIDEETLAEYYLTKADKRKLTRLLERYSIFLERSNQLLTKLKGAGELPEKVEAFLKTDLSHFLRMGKLHAEFLEEFSKEKQENIAKLISKEIVKKNPEKVHYLNDLPSVLITSVQRFPRYSLLFKEMRKILGDHPLPEFAKMLDVTDEQISQMLIVINSYI